MKAEDRATTSIAEQNYVKRGLAKMAIMEDLEKLRSQQVNIGKRVDDLYPAGTLVKVKLRYGQKRLTPAVVADAPAWQDGYIRIKLLNAKDHTRQKIRSVHINCVYYDYEEPR